MRPLISATASLALLSSCSAADNHESERSLDEAIAVIEGLPRVEKVVRLDERSDPNDMLGRSDGYRHAAVVYDHDLDCGGVGIECGAFLEVWDSREDAARRADQLASLQRGTPMLGREFHYFAGSMLLRVNADLKQPAAREYEAAFEE